MITKKVGGLVVEIPESMVVDGEELFFTSSDLRPVYLENMAPDDDTPIGYNLSYEVPGGGTVINGICVDGFGEVQVYQGPLDERDDYEHPDYRPIDTYFNPPDDFVEQVCVYEEYDEDEDEEYEDD
ncbi:hypothetical protein [Shewanella scandinavica]|uniref:hypothetical protein n=1 Tax=Shewanella scandinavica TaxID=3063538 RepID=UPI00319D09CE